MNAPATPRAPRDRRARALERLALLNDRERQVAVAADPGMRWGR